MHDLKLCPFIENEPQGFVGSRKKKKSRNLKKKKKKGLLGRVLV